MIGDAKEEVTTLLDPVLTREGFELVEIKLARYKNKYRLQVFVDCEGGIKLDDCARLSGLIGAAIDLTDLFSSGYILEVSSPGLDRPLKTLRDFRRRIGENLKVEFQDIDKVRSVDGILKDASDTALTLENKTGVMEIALDKVRVGKIII